MLHCVLRSKLLLVAHDILSSGHLNVNVVVPVGIAKDTDDSLFLKDVLLDHLEDSGAELTIEAAPTGGL